MSVEAYLARLPGVQAAVSDVQDRIYRRARANFASHDRPGGHRIKNGRPNRYDRAVYLVGPAPASVEFGHFTVSGDGYVEGLHVLGRASRGL